MIVLDTHALIWWVEGRGLSKPARAAIDREIKKEGDIVVSTMSDWEVMLLVKKGRLAMDVGGWFDKISRIDGIRFAPVDRRIAITSADLPDGFHSDPANRMIVATTRSLAAPLVTKDSNIRAYEHVKTIW